MHDHPYADKIGRKSGGGVAVGNLATGAETDTITIPPGRYVALTGIQAKNNTGADPVDLVIKQGSVTLFKWPFIADEGLAINCFIDGQDAGATAGDDMTIAVEGGAAAEDLDYTVEYIMHE